MDCSLIPSLSGPVLIHYLLLDSTFQETILPISIPITQVIDPFSAYLSCLLISEHNSVPFYCSDLPT